ncbi:transposase domain-containing protein [Photobacterium sagamiensis]
MLPSCRANGVDPYTRLRNVLTELLQREVVVIQVIYCP